jgi:hypothetical protein
MLLASFELFNLFLEPETSKALIPQLGLELEFGKTTPTMRSNTLGATIASKCIRRAGGVITQVERRVTEDGLLGSSAVCAGARELV